MSHVSQHSTDPTRYAKCIEVSKRIRWDTDRDVIRGRQFDFGRKFLPDGLSKVAPAAVPHGRRAAPVLADAGPHLRQHVRAGRALHRREDARGQPRPLARRPGRPGGAGAPDRRGAEAPGAVPAPGDDDGAGHARRLPVPAAAQRGGAGGAGGLDLGGAGADVRHRAVLAGALPQQHRPRDPDRSAVEGRVPVPLEGGVAARDHRRDGVAARGRAARRGPARPGGRRADRPGRRGRRHLPDAGQGRRRLLRAGGRPRVRRRSDERRSMRRRSLPTAGSTSSAACRIRASSSCSAR